MIQIYVKHTDGNFYLIDLENSESINLKLTVKDLNDISKIYSPFTQTFKIKATDKNKILFGFYGKESILSNVSKGLDSLIYISGNLFQSGILTPDSTTYEYLDQKEISVEFASALTGLNEKLGDSVIQDLFTDNDAKLVTEWTPEVLRDRLQSVKNTTLSNGIAFKWGIPFISNIRVWNWSTDTIVDNLKYKPTKTSSNLDYIALGEVRPAVNFMSIMNHLLLKIGTPVICPLFERAEVKDLFVWGSAENVTGKDSSPILLKGYNTLTGSGGKWTATLNTVTGVFKLKRNAVAGSWVGITLKLKFAGLVPLIGSETRIRINIVRNNDNVIIDSKEISGNEYEFKIIDESISETMFDPIGELFFRIEILPLTLVKWTSVSAFIKQTQIAIGTPTATYTTVNNTPSNQLGGNSFNLISILPEIECTNFLKSFFKMFNIAVFPTGKPDQSMFWLTPFDIKQINKEYSKRIVDYTQFTDVATLTKKKASKFNKFVFKHAESKYYDNTYGDGTQLGSLVYPLIDPPKVEKFEVETEYSIMKQSSSFTHPSGVRTAFGFSNDSPELAPNGGARFKPVYDEFTLMYLKPVSLGTNTLSSEFSPTANAQVFSLLQPSFKCANGKTLAFGIENTIDTDSLYLNYYKDFIELLLQPNTFLNEFILNLPPNEIFLNFSNSIQGESNIPTGFRGQNEIIIGEKRYILSDSTIDLTTGKTKLSLINK